MRIGVRLTVALVVFYAMGSLASTASASPAGFADTTLPTPTSNPLSAPTAIVPILGSGRALVLEKGGAVRVLQADGTMLTTDALTLSVCTDSEEGLLGAAIDPGFASNGFVYLYYTRNAGNCASSTGRFNRVSRFTMSGNTINPASELVLLDNMNIPAGNHNGGDLHVGNDGNLYVSVGDGGTNPRGSGPSAAQDLSLLNGKILRITTTGGVPADNPFVGAAGAASCATAGISTSTSTKCTEIYDYGLRNPFRFAFDPNSSSSSTRFFINDVGQDTWEEVDDGGGGLNYGWDSREGFCNEGSSTNCPPTPAGFTDPLTTYNHSSGCTFITAAAFIPDGIWAPMYDGGYLFGDGGCGKIFLMTSTGAVDYSDPFAQTKGLISDMAFLTQGGQTALYYVTVETGELHKITLPAPLPLSSLPLIVPVVPVTSKPALASSSATAPLPCTIVDVRGLLASTARTRIASSHCAAFPIVVAMRHGRPEKKGGELVRARTFTRPQRSAGRHRVWTLRVERVSPMPGGTHAAGYRRRSGSGGRRRRGRSQGSPAPNISDETRDERRGQETGDSVDQKIACGVDVVHRQSYDTPAYLEGYGPVLATAHRTKWREGNKMRAKHLRLALSSLVVAALCAVLPAVAGAVNYVSIGDSYTSGPGITPYAPSAPAGCGQSEKNYPHLTASALNLSLTDVSCGGATTSDETESQFEGQAPQDDALSASTEVVTVGMGGNDHGLFGTLLNGCTQTDAIEHRTGKAPCKEQYESYVASTYAEDTSEQAAALQHIKELAPNAKVFVVGYPEITPKDGVCGSSEFPWYPKDLQWFRNKVQKVGNKMIKAGAKANGAIFVDTFKPSEGHNACAGASVRWIEPLIGSLTGVAVHPNATGEQQDAYDVELAMLKAGIR